MNLTLSFQQAKQLCILHAAEMKAQFPEALEVFLFAIEPEVNTENTPRALMGSVLVYIPSRDVLLFYYFESRELRSG